MSTRLLRASGLPALLLPLLLAATCDLPRLGWPRREPPPPPVPPQTAFSGERAAADMRALVDLGPRHARGPGAQGARELIRTRLEELGYDVSLQDFEVTDPAQPEAPPLAFENVAATLDSDRGVGYLLLATHFDSDWFESFEFVGANDGASGTALLLELARVFAEDPLPYGVAFAFLDGEGRLPGGRPESALGARSLVQGLREAGLLRQVRLTVYADQVADADLAFPRDMLSDRDAREAFWRAAARLGHTQAFAPDAPMRSVPGPHPVLRAAGLRRMVVLVDDAYGGEEPPGPYAHTADDTLAHTAQESLAIAGQVTELALRELAAHYRYVDRFAPPTRYAAPEPDAGDEAATDDTSGDGAADASTDAVVEDPAADALPDAAAGPEPSATPGDASDASPATADPPQP